MKEFPILSDPLGYLFFEEDFKQLFPGKDHLFLVKWPTLYKHFLAIASKKEDKYLKKFIEDNLADSNPGILV